MSDVIVSTNDPITTVTTTDNLVEIAITNNPVEVSASTAGVQGASYNQGDPIFVTVRNATGATLPKGTIVYISGSNGNHVQVTKAIATSDATSARTLGWLAESIANNASGLCQVEGYLEGLNTHGLTSGSQLYLSGTTAGSFTVTKPQAPIHLVYVGVVTKVSAGDGHVFVKVQNGYELEELHDVQITSVTNGDLLQYESSTDLWKNRNLTTAGIAKLAGGNAFTDAQTITATAIGQVPLTLVGASGQTANLFSVQDSTGSIRVRINQVGNSTFAGNITSQNNALFTPFSAATVPVTIQGASGQTADILAIQNNGSTNLAVFSSTGTFRTAGLITAGDVSNVLGQLTVYTTVASRIGAVIRGAASQSADLLQIQNSGGTNLTRFDQFGGMFGIYGNFISDSATTRPLLVKGAASQSADLQQWQNSAGSIIAKVDSVGDITARVQRSTFAARFTTTDPSIAIQVNTAATGQTGDFIQFQNAGGTVVSEVSASGSFYVNTNNNTTGIEFLGTSGTQLISANGNDLGLRPRFDILFSPADSSGRLRPSNDNTSDLGTSGQRWRNVYSSGLFVTNSTAGNVVATIKGAASQSGNLLEIQNSAGTILSRFTSTGLYSTSTSPAVAGIQHTSGSGAYFAFNHNVGSATLFTNAAANKGLVVRGEVSQTANLTEWQDSTSAIKARVDSGGNFKSTNVASLNSAIQMTENASGGLMVWGRATATASNPGANFASLYFRDGTNAGTLKLVVRAGAAGAETTILDNIPQ
jgi:hypothetical protein